MIKGYLDYGLLIEDFSFSAGIIKGTLVTGAPPSFAAKGAYTVFVDGYEVGMLDYVHLAVNNHIQIGVDTP